MNNLFYTYCLAIFFLSSYNSAAQPDNNNLCDALSLTVAPINSMANCGGLFPYDNTGAGPQPGETYGCWGSSGAAPTIWFSFVAPQEGLIAVSTNLPNSPLDDTAINLYEGTISCPDNIFSGLNRIGCSEDIDDSNFLSEIPRTLVTPGDTYYVQASGFDGETGAFCIEVFEVLPCNDDSVCDIPIEDICNCADCVEFCTTAVAEFLDTLGMTSMTPIAYCESEISTTSNSSPSAIFIPMKATSPMPADLECVHWELSSTQGSFYSNDATIVPIDSIAHDSVFFLKITDDEIMATGMTTITFTALNTPELCSFTFDIDWTGITASQCCAPPNVRVSYDCDLDVLVVNVINIGTPAMNSAFVITPNIGEPQTIVESESYSFAAADPDLIYSVMISDGSSSCDLFFGDIQPDCPIECPDTLNVMGDIMSELYKADTVLISNGIVLSMQNVIFQAGFEIILEADFEVILGADFSTQIAPCETPEFLQIPESDPATSLGNKPVLQQLKK